MERKEYEQLREELAALGPVTRVFLVRFLTPMTQVLGEDLSILLHALDEDVYHKKGDCWGTLCPLSDLHEESGW